MADISRAEGEITEVGTPINIDALNDLESRISNALESMGTSIKIEKIKSKEMSIPGEVSRVFIHL